MRIVLDLQGAQTESRFRGIGRYSMSFAHAVVRNRGDHEIILALSGLFPETIDPIREAFKGVLPPQAIQVWNASGPVREDHEGNRVRREHAEEVRERFIASFAPDFVHVSSLFEGYVDDAVTSIGEHHATAPISVSFYDLIPLLNPAHYLDPHPRYSSYYRRKIRNLGRANLLFAISEFTRQEALESLAFAPEQVVNVSSAVEPTFARLDVPAEEVAVLRQQLGIRGGFVLYAGGADERKNLPRLIEAYSALPLELRDRFQLVLAGRMPAAHVEALQRVALDEGIPEQQVVFTGYVSEPDLLRLYNLCDLYVFPSWHEGFGLPALEAMACGAAVIASNTTSLPEVIGDPRGLFDPMDVRSIASKMRSVLEDAGLRASLREAAVEQACKFSWDETARTAIAAWEHASASCAGVAPARSGASHAATCPSIRAESALGATDDLAHELDPSGFGPGGERQLLLDISELHSRDSATGVQRVVRNYMAWLLKRPPKGFRVELVYASVEGPYYYARRFRSRWSDEIEVDDAPMQWQPGDVFFGLDMQHHVQLAHADLYKRMRAAGVMVKFLVHDLLPIEFPEHFADPALKSLHERLMTLIAACDGAICVSKATADAFARWAADAGLELAPGFELNYVHNGSDLDRSGPGTPISQEPEFLHHLRVRPTFLVVSTLEPRKRQDQVLDAFDLLWKKGVDANLVLVGPQGWNVDGLVERILTHREYATRLFWLHGIDDATLAAVYAASTCLLAASVNEGFGLSLVEAARHGVPVLARDIPVFREVGGNFAEFFEGDTGADLAEAIQGWMEFSDSCKAREPVRVDWPTWEISAERLKSALLCEMAPSRQILVDVSELVVQDARSGIQRVVRSVLQAWLQAPPDGYRIEPVYASMDIGYRYARAFLRNMGHCTDDLRQEEPVHFSAGDIFFGLDLQPIVVVAQRDFYRHLRDAGVWTEFMVYDLLPIELPDCFPQGSAEGFERWLDVVAEADAITCISRAVAESAERWIRARLPAATSRLPRIRWNHIGADLENSMPSRGLPPDYEVALKAIRASQSFLMVGTLEPRKGHQQVLEAFEKLWSAGDTIQLVIVGKPGWMVDQLADRVRGHAELGSRLFWFDGASDEYLERIYDACTCLIVASYGEGFGLPLIEAAQHAIPILARDLSVFREVAGKHAFYFQADAAQELADAILAWRQLYSEGRAPVSTGIPVLTWAESSARLLQMVIEGASAVRGRHPDVKQRSGLVER